MIAFAKSRINAAADDEGISARRDTCCHAGRCIRQPDMSCATPTTTGRCSTLHIRSSVSTLSKLSRLCAGEQRPQVITAVAQAIHSKNGALPWVSQKTTVSHTCVVRSNRENHKQLPESGPLASARSSLTKESLLPQIQRIWHDIRPTQQMHKATLALLRHPVLTSGYQQTRSSLVRSNLP